jgi:hypothetical protein
MKVISIEEREDGSAMIDMEMSEEEKRLLIEYAVVDLLRKYIEEQDSESDQD